MKKSRNNSRHLCWKEIRVKIISSSLKTLIAFPNLIVLIILFSLRCYGDEIIKHPFKESSGFEWIHVIYRSNGDALTGAQANSGEWIIPLGDYLICFFEFEKNGKEYGYFQVTKEMKDGSWKSSLMSPAGEELVERGRYGMFLWSDNRLLGTGPENYEAIHVDLSKLLLSKTSTSNINTSFNDVTKQFFSQSKTYSISQICIPLGRIQRTYERGESTFKVINNGYAYKLNDGSGKTHNFNPQLKNVSVMTSDGNVNIPMYMIENGDAVRVIKDRDGSFTVYEYTKNNNSGNFVLLRFYILF